MFVNLYNYVSNLGFALSKEEGQDLAEYALVLVFIAVIAVAGVGALGTTVTDIFTQINTGLTSGG